MTAVPVPDAELAARFVVEIGFDAQGAFEQQGATAIWMSPADTAAQRAMRTTGSTAARLTSAVEAPPKIRSRDGTAARS